MRRLLAAVALVALASSSAMAAPTYLACTLVDSKGEGAVHFDVTVNESAGTVGYSIQETGLSLQNLTATFTPKSVVFRGNLEDKIEINRETLTIFDDFPYANISRGGKCKIASKAKSQF